MSKKNKERIIMIILLVVISVLLVVISGAISKIRENSVEAGEVTPTPSPTSTPSPTPNPTPTPSPTPTPNPSPTASPTPTIEPVEEFIPPIEADINELIAEAQNNPHKGMFEPVERVEAFTTTGMDYFNFYNGVRCFSNGSGAIEFGLDGTVKFTGVSEEMKERHISQFVNLKEYFSGVDTSDSAVWFFVGAIEADKSIYAVYDYWGSDNLTLVFRIEKGTDNANFVYGCFYHDPELPGIITATQEHIYCVYTTYGDTPAMTASSILQSDVDGTGTKLLVSFPAGYSVHNLFPYEDSLYFFATDLKGNTNLMKYDTTTLELSYIVEKCPYSDFLYIYNGFALTGVSGNNKIHYYNLETRKVYSMNASTTSSHHVGNPMTDGNRLYIPVFAWTSSADTRLVPLDLQNAKTLEPVKLDSTYYYIVGISGKTVYAENGAVYKTYTLN